ncbi:Hypothetical protein I596_2904 [Dokdonella koreensis DS-123]|uniref:Uncharacterized protein n=1 Tax=Dokdonella koreensis DS-123 TaxID=1300342 RepID=A0A160DWB1_9GAMM|nr:Hypothetical protein I596_2904 [Dokdonella koreensis DS-123]
MGKAARSRRCDQCVRVRITGSGHEVLLTVRGDLISAHAKPLWSGWLS